MLSKISVKKPYTVFVAVVLALVLGVISFMNLTTDLLPAIELPYVIVMTTYPGASPEKIEQSVTKPLETALGTTGGISNVSSVSNENMSMIILEFEQSTNMDSAMIEISGNVDLVKAQLEDGVGAPMLMRLSPDMLPVMVASVDMDGVDMASLSEMIDEELLVAFERLDGVAGVDATGLLAQQISVTLNQEKIDILNDRVLGNVDSELAKAQAELRKGVAQLNEGQQKLNEGKAALEGQKTSTFNSLAELSLQLDSAIATLSGLQSEKITLTAIKTERDAYQQAVDAYQGLNSGLSAAKNAALTQAQQGILTQVNAALAQMGYPPAADYADAVQQYAAINAAMGGALPALPEADALVAGIPGSVDELLALSATDFAAFQAQMGAVDAQFASLTQESAAQLKAAWQTAQTRLAEIAASYPGLDSRLKDLDNIIAATKNQLTQLETAYKQMESGKLTAVNEITKGEVTLQTTQQELDAARSQLKEAQEQFDTARDTAYKQADLGGIITQQVVSNLLMAQNFNMPAGYVTENGEQYLVKVGEEYDSVAALSDAILFYIDVDGVGEVRLCDVADVAVTSNEGDTYARVNGNDAVVLSFQKQSTASTAVVSDSINDTIANLEERYPGLHITPLMDQGDYIRMIINSVLQNLLLGGLLAVLVLALFLKDVKPTLIVAASIPFSLLCAITAMYFSGITLNIISLSGLALGVGMLVDNSIVAIENIYRLRSEGVSAAKAAVLGAKQISGAIFASTLTTICVFLPIVFTDGLSRQLFTDMGLTIAYALLASLVVALTLVPALAAGMLRTTRVVEHRWFDAFLRGYEKLLSWCLQHKAPVLVLSVALLLLSAWQTTRMGTSFIPSMDSPQMSVTMTMPKNSTKADTYAMADIVMERINAIDSVETVGAMSGGGSEMMTGGGSSSGITYYVLLAEKRSLSNTQVEQEIYDVTKDLNCEVAVSASTMDMSALGGSGLEMVITGQNLDTMQAVAEEMRQLLRGVEGTADISENTSTANPETRITVDKDAAMRKGLTVAQVYSEVAAALKGSASATTLRAGGTDYPVIVLKSEATALTRETILQHTFIVKAQDGTEQTVRLADIATARETDSVSAINRANGVRTLSVTAGIGAGYNVGLVARDVQAALGAYQAPDGIRVELSGESESINDALFDLVLMVLLAVVFIYLIMVAQFQSLMSPFIVMFTIPLAFTGGLLALWLTGSTLSVISMLGFLVLAGVVVNNGIVFVDTINQLRLDGLPRKEAILRTGMLRARPVLMTALTTILAMSTMALGIGQGAEMTQSMAIVTVGGLAYATVLTLVVVPVLYDLLRKKELRVVEVDDV